MSRFKRELLKPQYDLLQLSLTIPKYPDLFVSIQKFEHTAALVQWVREADVVDGQIRRGTLQAVSLLLTGIDETAHELAILACESSTDALRKRLRAPPWVYTKIRGDVRPILATIYCTGRSRSDPSIRMEAEELARAFFNQFGAEGDRAEYDRRFGQHDDGHADGNIE